MVGLDDLKGLFQPKQFYDSVYVYGTKEEKIKLRGSDKCLEGTGDAMTHSSPSQEIRNQRSCQHPLRGAHN